MFNRKKILIAQICVSFIVAKKFFFEIFHTHFKCHKQFILQTKLKMNCAITNLWSTKHFKIVFTLLVQALKRFRSILKKRKFYCVTWLEVLLIICYFLCMFWCFWKFFYKMSYTTFYLEKALIWRSKIFYLTKIF